MGDISVVIFLETLENLLTSSNNIIKHNRNQFQSLVEEIQYLREFLKKTEKKRNDHPEVMELVMQIRDEVSKTEDIVERFVARASKAKHYLLELQDHLFRQLKSAKKGIKNLTAKVEHILNKNMYDIDGEDLDKKLERSSIGLGGGSSSSATRTTYKVGEENVVVGFKDEVTNLLRKVHDNGDHGQLEIISIICAGGGGKTTLAREVYDHSLTLQKFEIRIWVTVSQDYNTTMMRNLLLSILKSGFPEGEHDMSAGDLGETLLKCLRGKKYLIVMDDIWDPAAWSDIQRSFIKEYNGSKVLFTSRHPVQPNNIKCIPHHLNPLSENCSWELLRKKVFKKEECPPELVDIGMNIATKCQGLPLAIVAIAGLLAAENKTLDVWKQVANNLSSVIAKKQVDAMQILELSYNHLPLHLKACFLYVGAHPEDFEIPVRELMWLWIAEGFIQKSGWKSLEDKANDYLNDLIGRNLIMVAKKNWIGTVIKCYIHDLLRELCIKKGKEEKFFGQNYGDDSFSSSETDKHRRLFIGPHLYDKYNAGSGVLSLRSFLCPTVPANWSKDERKNFQFSFQDFELLRVFHVKFSTLGGDASHTMEGDRVHLRYLAFKANKRKDDIGPSDIFGYNSNLEIVNHNFFGHLVTLPENIFKMVRLRHVHFRHGGMGCPSFDEEEKGNMLYSLQTLFMLAYCADCPNFLKRTPYLRKLGLVFGLFPMEDKFYCCLDFLKCLEILEVRGPREIYADELIKLPPTITKLSLRGTFLSWEKLEIILQTLPNLEVLILLDDAVIGKIWNTSELEEELSPIKYLKIDDLEFEEWRASEDLFPKLEILQIEDCKNLKGIPSEFGNLHELREIRLRFCTDSVEESAMKIQEEQKNMKGDDGACQIIRMPWGYPSDSDWSSDDDYDESSDDDN